MPDLQFDVVGAEMLTFAAVPTLLFKLSVHNARQDEQIHGIMLRAQVRIEAPQRRYDGEETVRLRELFGEPSQWQATVRSLLWTHVHVSVPPFGESILADVPVTCTYDFEVVGTKYLAALDEGVVPLLFLFSGTVLYSRGGGGLQVAQIPWEKEAPYGMPIRLWKETMDHYFPNSAWIRVQKNLYDQLCSFKARNTLLTWEEVIERLLLSEHAGEH